MNGIETIFAEIRAAILRAKEKVCDVESQKALDELFIEIRNLEKYHILTIGIPLETMNLLQEPHIQACNFPETDSSSQ